MGKKKSDDEGGGAPEWMCTFSDLMSLLLCFFILLFSISSIEKQKFVQAINSIQGALGRIPELFNTSYVKPKDVVPQKVEPTQRTKTIQRAKEAIAKKARSKLVVDETSKEIIVEGVKEGIRFSLVGRVLFEPGSATLSPNGQALIDKIGEILNEFPNRIRIEGHTDSSSISANSAFIDNWRLAQARAFSVLHHFRDRAPLGSRIDEERMNIMSCSDNRPRFPNDTPEDRALNRRVEIVLLQGSDSESILGILKETKSRKENIDEEDIMPN
jgi:chemotaxis protein MotB